MMTFLRSIGLLAGLGAAHACAATFIVNNTNVTGAGSLQQAIADANATPGADLIVFNIPGDGPHTISPTALQPLPSLTDAVTIDGYTQPGAIPNTLTNGNNAEIKIQLNGLSAGAVNGLRVASSGNVIRGLAITRFRNTVDGIQMVAGANNNLIEGNFIGFSPTGVVLGNGRHGIYVLNSSGNVIGGTNPASANVISGNLQYGLVIQGASAGNNRVQGNVIGLAPDGSRRSNNVGGMFVNGAPNNIIGGEEVGARNVISGNSGSGMRLTSTTGNSVLGNFVGLDFSGTVTRSNTIHAMHFFDTAENTIGGTNSGARNVLSGNSQNGVRLEGNSHSNHFLGNYIGTDFTGRIPVPNGSNGVVFMTSFSGGIPMANVVGGISSVAANLIAHNRGAGILVLSGINNSFRGNSMFSNTGIGIDLGGNGVTDNDSGDSDTGANQLQNFPVLTNATVMRTNFTLQGWLNSRPNAAFQADFYASTSCDVSGHGQGRWWVGGVEVITDAGGNAVFSAALTGAPPGMVITATATDASGNTSEFSPCLELTNFFPSMTFTVTNTNDSGPGSLRQALLDVNEHVSIDTINFNIPGGGVQTISPLSALPVPLDPVTLNGYTQPGTIPNTLTNGNNAALKLRLDGSLAGGPDVTGLRFINTRNNVLRGLVIVGFSGHGIEFEGGGGNVVQDVWIGLDVNVALGMRLAQGDVSAQGDGPSGNLGDGLRFRDSSDNQVSHVVSSYNGMGGIRFTGSDSYGNRVSYSCFGGDADWSQDRGNLGSGVIIRKGAGANSFLGVASMHNGSYAYNVEGSFNSFFDCFAGWTPGNAWNIKGGDNSVSAASANYIGGHALAIESGTRNFGDFASVRNVMGDFIHLGGAANAGALPLTDLSVGTGNGLVRMGGTIQGMVSGLHTIRGLVEDTTAPVSEIWYHGVFELPVTKSTVPFAYNLVTDAPLDFAAGSDFFGYAATPNGSTAMTGPITVVLDNNPDMTVDLTSTSGTSSRIGDKIQFSFTVGNLGVGTAQTPTANLVSSLPVTAIDFPGAIITHVTGGHYTLRFPPLAPGAQMQGSATVVPTVVGVINVTASVAVEGQTDANPSNNSDSLGGSVSSNSGSTPVVTDANQGMAGDSLHPVSMLTGELFEYLPPDFSLGGPMPLAFSRYYASFLNRVGVTGTLGENWRQNFEWSLSDHATSVEIMTDLGRLITFTNLAGNYQLIVRTDIPFQLHTNGGNYILADPQSQRLYTFNASGQLTQIADGRGNNHTLAYTGDKLSSVSDGLGRALTFQYSAGGFLTNVSDGTRSVAFTQTGNNLTSVRNPLGLVSTYGYNLEHAVSGLLTNAVMPEGNVPYAQTFDSLGRVATQTEAGSNTHSFAYVVGLTTLVDPLGRTRKDIHTPSGELLAFTDENNQTLAMGYNTNGQRTAIADRLGNLTRLGFHAPSGYVSAITNADGTFTTFSYTGRAVGGLTFFDLAQVTYPDGAMESFTRDSSGNILTRTDRSGNVFTFTYNARGQVLTSQNPLGGIVTRTYHANGLLASRTDSDTGTTTLAYDTFSRLTNVVHPDGTMLKATYDANDRVMSITDERNNTSTFAYDDNGNLISATDSLSQTAQFAYDTRDRLLQTMDRLGKTSSVSYDQLDHIAGRTDRNANVTQYTYDTRRRLTSVTDAGNQVWSFGYDHEALLTSASNPLNQTNRIRRDALGYIVASTNALGQTASLVRDSLRRVTATVDGLSRTNGFGYDSRGLLTNALTPVIGNAAYERNSLGLLSRITGLNGEQWEFAYTPMGRRQSVADPLNRTNSFTYDNRGRSAVTTFADGTTRKNSYDQAGNLTRRFYSAGPDLQYAYDALDRVVSADNVTLAYDAESRITNTTSSSVQFGAAYDAGGRLTNVTYNGGLFSVTYAYDSRDRLISASDSLTGTTLSFTYDHAGRLTGTTRPNGVNGTYTYDAAGRLTRIQEGAIIDLQYGLDAAAQVTNLNYTMPLEPTNFLSGSISNWTYDAAHQISNSGYTYDARGRQTAAPGRTQQYDAASRLTQINSATLGYNGFSDIITRTEGGVMTRYFYNHALGMKPIVAEKNESTGQFRYYIWSPGGRLLYMIDHENVVRHFHFDRVGSTLALTDAGGAVTDSYAYTPYGELLGRTGTNSQPFLYIGRFGVRSEPGVKLYHMRARYYDPVSARFLTRDPIWPVSAKPKSLDPYQYVEGNPLSFIDPLGLESSQDGALIISRFGTRRCGHADCNFRSHCRMLVCDHLSCFGHGRCDYRGPIKNINYRTVQHIPTLYTKPRKLIDPETGVFSLIPEFDLISFGDLSGSGDTKGDGVSNDTGSLGKPTAPSAVNQTGGQTGSVNPEKLEWILFPMIKYLDLFGNPKHWKPSDKGGGGQPVDPNPEGAPPEDSILDEIDEVFVPA